MLTGHTSYIYSLIVLKDGSLATGSGDNTVRLWTTKNGGICLKVLECHRFPVTCFTLLLDGTLISGG